MTKSRDHLRGILYLRYSTHNMNTMKNFLLCSALLGLMAWSGCKKEPCTDPTNPECVNYCFDPTDPDCDGYDPCTAQTPVSAEFRIIEDGSYGLREHYDTVYYDTVASIRLIHEAVHVHPDWTYTWQIGTGRYDGPNLNLTYTNAPKDQPIYITLFVEGPPNFSCFPMDDGRDTLVRKVVFTIDPFFASLFHGYLNGNPEDTITLGWIKNPNPLLITSYNFKRGCFTSSVILTQTKRSTGFYPTATNHCDRPRGRMVRDPHKTGDWEKVRAEYILTPPGEDTLQMVFEGRRVKP